MAFDVQRAMLKGPDLFSRFRVIEKPNTLIGKKLTPSERLIVFERAGEKRALLARQMAYHHVAQGELAGKPFLITF